MDVYCRGLAIFLAALWVGQSASAQAPAAPFSLTISSPGATIKSGFDIPIKIRITNLSGHDVDCTGVPSNGVDKAYEYEVMEVDTKAVPPTIKSPSGHALPYSIVQCKIKPGESSEVSTTLINHAFQMKPGLYVVQVTRYVTGNNRDNGVVESNRLTVNVIR